MKMPKMSFEWLESAVMAAAILLGLAFIVALSAGILEAFDKIKTECVQHTCSSGSHAVFTQSGCLCGPVDGCCAPAETP